MCSVIVILYPPKVRKQILHQPVELLRNAFVPFCAHIKRKGLGELDTTAAEGVIICYANLGSEPGGSAGVRDGLRLR